MNLYRNFDLVLYAGFILRVPMTCSQVPEMRSYLAGKVKYIFYLEFLNILYIEVHCLRALFTDIRTYHICEMLYKLLLCKE